MGRIVIVAYKPKEGCEQDLEALVQGHVSLLRKEGLVSQRAAVVMRADDNSVIEVFEWLSESAIEQAHNNQAVQALWQQFSEVCEYIPVSQIAEAATVFSEFTPLDEYNSPDGVSWP